MSAVGSAAADVIRAYPEIGNWVVGGHSLGGAMAARFVPIEGGNHAQFGSYGAQNGDSDATISSTAQQAEIVDATVLLLREVTSKR